MAHKSYITSDYAVLSNNEYTIIANSNTAKPLICIIITIIIMIVITKVATTPDGMNVIQRHEYALAETVKRNKPSQSQMCTTLMRTYHNRTVGGLSHQTPMLSPKPKPRTEKVAIYTKKEER